MSTPIENKTGTLSEKNSSKLADLQARLLNQAVSDYNIFYEHILGYNSNGQGMPAHQERWGDILQDNDKVMLLAPACHGKSTLTSVGYPLWEIAKDRGIRIGIVTSNDNLAEDILSEIKSHFEENEMLHAYFGQFKPARPVKWSRYEVRVENSGGVTTLRKKDATISVGGPLSSWKGKRLDLLLTDDMVDEKNASTRERAMALIDWFWSTLYTRLEPWARAKIVGTVEKEYDFYHDIMKNPRGFKIVHEKAILNEQTKQVLWPEKWSYDKLAEMRSNNFPAFMKHFQNIIVSQEVAKISQEHLDRCYDQSWGMYPHGIPDDVRSQMKMIFTTVDPAWTRNKRSKYSVIATIGWRHDDRRQILDVKRMQVEYDELFNWIKLTYNTLRPHYVIVETNQMQAVLERELAKCAIPTIATFTTGAKNYLDMGIPMLYSVVGSGMILLPAKDQPSREVSDQFVHELMSWPDGEFSDVLMAYYFAEQEIRKRTMSVKVVNRSVINGDSRGASRFARHYSLTG